MEIILASSSPRRKELLKKLIKFRAIESSFKEITNGPVKRLVEQNAIGKAMDIAKRFKDAIVIGADTVVYYNKEVLGKPRDEEHAKIMLKKISGKWITVYGAIAIAKQNKVVVDTVKTKVKIREMTEKEIEEYIKTKEPLDKAGAFGAQGRETLIIEKINGDYFNVVGLSLYKLREMLLLFDIDILNYYK